MKRYLLSLGLLVFAGTSTAVLAEDATSQHLDSIIKRQKEKIESANFLNQGGAKVSTDSWQGILSQAKTNAEKYKSCPTPEALATRLKELENETRTTGVFLTATETRLKKAYAEGRPALVKSMIGEAISFDAWSMDGLDEEIEVAGELVGSDSEKVKIKRDQFIALMESSMVKDLLALDFGSDDAAEFQRVLETVGDVKDDHKDIKPLMNTLPSLKSLVDSHKDSVELLAKSASKDKQAEEVDGETITFIQRLEDALKSYDADFKAALEADSTSDANSVKASDMKKFAETMGKARERLASIKSANESLAECVDSRSKFVERMKRINADVENADSLKDAHGDIDKAVKANEAAKRAFDR